MEDSDDYQPNASGHLDLKYRGWSVVQTTLWTFTHCLISLDLSFNLLQTLPLEISKFQHMEELYCSCNKLQSLPESIGSLERLRVIKINGNRITTIPKEIGNCKHLEQLIVSENQLTSLPQDIAGCYSLKLLLLQNNDLCRLPLSLSTLSGHLRDLDVSNNNHQLTVTLPTEIHRDVHSIMWILALQREKLYCIDRFQQDVKILRHEVIALEDELITKNEKIAILEEKRRTLENDFKSVEYYLTARAHARKVKCWALKLWEECKFAFNTNVNDNFFRTISS